MRIFGNYGMRTCKVDQFSFEVDWHDVTYSCDGWDASRVRRWVRHICSNYHARPVQNWGSETRRVQSALFSRTGKEQLQATSQFQNYLVPKEWFTPFNLEFTFWRMLPTVIGFIRLKVESFKHCVKMLECTSARCFTLPKTQTLNCGRASWVWRVASMWESIMHHVHSGWYLIQLMNPVPV